MRNLRDDGAGVKRVIRRSGALIGSVTSVRTRSGHVVLSYDDGPEPAGTDRVLAALADARVHATFFVLLTRARLYPGLLGEVVAAGHEIALHGIDHRPLTEFSVRDVRHKTRDGRAELEELTGHTVRWMRPPYGRQTPGTWAAIRSAGLQPVLWGSTAWDSQDVDTDTRLRKVREGSAAGAILLCHDGFADSRDGVDDGAAPLLDRGDLARRVLEQYGELGLTPCSLSEAMTDGTLVREAVFRR